MIPGPRGGQWGVIMARCAKFLWGKNRTPPPPQIASLKIIQLRISKVYAVLGEMLLPAALSEDRIVFPAKSEDLLPVSNIRLVGSA